MVVAAGGRRTATRRRADPRRGAVAASRRSGSATPRYPRLDGGAGAADGRRPPRSGGAGGSARGRSGTGRSGTRGAPRRPDRAVGGGERSGAGSRAAGDANRSRGHANRRPAPQEIRRPVVVARGIAAVARAAVAGDPGTGRDRRIGCDDGAVVLGPGRGRRRDSRVGDRVAGRLRRRVDSGLAGLRVAAAAVWRQRRKSAAQLPGCDARRRRPGRDRRHPAVGGRRVAVFRGRGLGAVARRRHQHRPGRAGGICADRFNDRAAARVPAAVA